MGYYGNKLTGMCVSQCPNGTFADEIVRLCVYCDFNCLTCQNFSLNCLTCKYDWLVKENNCSEPSCKFFLCIHNSFII